VNTNPGVLPAEVPALPKGAVVAHVIGGVYYATAEEVAKVLSDFNFAPRNLRQALVDIDPSDEDETAAFYRDADIVTMAVIMAWFTSSMNTPEKPWM
jgi:hypothetical protein